jgi:hypothetical protein
VDLIENEFEKALILRLSPNARDLAEYLFSTQPLKTLLEMRYKTGLQPELTEQYHLSERQALPLLNALLLAKATYFLPNPKFAASDYRYLIQLACESAGFDLNSTSVPEILASIKGELPIFHQWLSTFYAQEQALLKEKSHRV